MSGETLERWSGPAAAIGGSLWLLPWSGWMGEISDPVRLYLSLPGLLLVAVGLNGLYRRLQAGRGRRPAFGLALGGLLLLIGTSVARLVTTGADAETPAVFMVFIFAGAFAMLLGIAAMGVIALSGRVLGAWSFAPLALTVAFAGYLVAFGLTANDESMRPVAQILIGLTIIGWLLLGYGLWAATTQNQPTRFGWGILLFLAIGNALGHVVIYFFAGPDPILLAWIAMNALAAAILLVPYRRGEKWAWYAIWGLVIAYGGLPIFSGVANVIYLGETVMMSLGQLLTYSTFFPQVSTA